MINEQIIECPDGSFYRKDGGSPETSIFEKLADIEHQRWADWQKYLHSLCDVNPNGSLTIPSFFVNKWKKQIETPYQRLSEKEKDSDREQVQRYWNLINPNRF
ncbi:MAG: hypothetical protein WC823_00120 [Parcubacteria group bacterium]|jgi:hypothetical protein